MATFLNRINSYSPAASEFTFLFASWIANLIDNMNENLRVIEGRLNQTSAPQYTTAEITALAIDAPNGTFWYDIDTDELKCKINNIVVVIA